MKPQRLKDTFFKRHSLVGKQAHKQLKHNELSSVKKNMQRVMEVEVCKRTITLMVSKFNPGKEGSEV